MSPQELHNMIQRIKKLPDNLLIRILKTICVELDNRNKKRQLFIPEQWQKG